MAITRSQFEQVLLRRTGKFLEAFELSMVADGTNGDLIDPIANALTRAGYSLVDYFAPTALELAAVTAADTPKVIDYAELRLLETLAASNTLVDIAVGPRKESLSQLQKVLESAIANKRSAILALYGNESGQWGAVELVAPDFDGSSEYA